MQKKLMLCSVIPIILFLAVLPSLGQSPENRATLVIVDSRDPNLWDYRVRFYDETGAEVATMKHCQIVRLSLTPGPHKFWSNKGKKKAITFSAVAGETYYAAGGLKNPLSQFMRFDFDLVTRAEAESWASKCKLPASTLDAEAPKAVPQP
ncbi:MAG: hypothetical protein ROO76_10155 [Terriglobia bacterium]|jgi:hypothetical protein|nr:hypothetical protein [Terriglobia bacterium]